MNALTRYLCKKKRRDRRRKSRTTKRPSTVSVTDFFGPSHLKVLAFVLLFTQSRGYAPTLSEIGAKVGRWKSGLTFVVRDLVKCGLLSRDGPRLCRTIRPKCQLLLFSREG